MTIFISEESTEVVRLTLQKEIRRLNEKVSSLNKALFDYENRFGFSSEEFFYKFNNGELGDDQIFFDWFTDLETRNRIVQRLKLLEKVKFM
ncbi:MAG: hypothetical protein ACTSW1_13290 [Candidatus Hodarchaeales archaeon]